MEIHELQSMLRERYAEKISDSLKTPEKAGTEILARFPQLIGARKEHFVAIFLDTARRVIGHETISIGTLDTALVHPRELFRPACLYSAAFILVAHNHPSGNLHPSNEDKLLTRRLSEAGLMMGIEVCDHLIVDSISGSTLSLRMVEPDLFVRRC